MIKKKKTVVHHINSLDEKYHVLMLKIEYTFFGKRVYKKKKEEIHEGLYLKNPY